MAKTIIQASGSNTTTANTVEYFGLYGHIQKSSGAGADGARSALFRTAGVLSNLYIRLNANSVAAVSTIRTYKNGGNGGQSVSVGSSATGEFIDTSGTDTISAADKIAVQSNEGAATGTYTFTIIGTTFAATTNTVSKLGVSFPTIATASTTYYANIAGHAANTLVTADSADVRTEMAKAGTLKNLSVQVTTNARTTNTVIKSRKNGADGNLTVTFGNLETGWKEDTTNSDTVAAGDDMGYSVTTSTGAQNLTGLHISTEYETTTGHGVSVYSTGDAVTFTDATIKFAALGGRVQNLSTEADQKMDAGVAYTFSNLTVRISQNGVTSPSLVTLRKNGADTTLQVSITASTTGIFSDTTHTETVASTDEMNYEIDVPSVAGTQTITLKWITVWTFFLDLTRISLSRVYKYHVLGRISLSRIYKYHVLGRVSLSRIYKYNILGGLTRISLSRIYKYHVLQRVASPSILFDGTNDYIDCTDDATLWSQGLTKFSFAFWIYSTSAFDNTRIIVDHGTIGTVSAHPFGCLTDVTNKIIFRIRNAATSSVSVSQDMTENTWNHVACVYDSTLGSANMKIYVNGTSGTTSNLTQTITKTATLKISDSTTDFKGNLKDFRWFTTKALTQTEIDDIRANSSSAPTPDYWLKMEEGTGNPVDTISGSKVGTLTNGPTWTAGFSPSVWGPSKTFKYNVLARVSLSRAYLWNVIAGLTRISLSRVYKYHVVGRISLARIYKYHVQKRVSLSRIYKYHVVGRISLARIYKYNVIARTSLARIYKYHVQKRVSLSRVYKYHVAVRVSLNRIYKYNILSRTSLQRIYKYHVQKRVSLARVYKYNLIGRLSLSRIYKYHVIGRISLSRIHKYHVAVRVSLARIYKYHIQKRVSLVRIYKYHIATRVSLSRIYKYNLIGRISLSRIYKYHVLQRISLPRIYKYNLIGRVSLARVYKYHVLARRSLARIYKYNVLSRTSLARVYKYNVIARVSLARVYLWNVIAEGLIRISLARTYKYHIANRVSLSRIYKYHVATRVSLARIYKYNVLSRTSLQRIYKYHVLARTSLSRIYRYNIIGRISVPRIYRYNIQSRVSLQRIYKYNVLARISLARIYRYNIVIRTSLSRIYKYNVIARVSLARVYKWNVLSALARISKQQIYKYHVIQRLSLQNIYKYHILNRISLVRIYKWNLLQKISIARIYKYHVLGRVSLSRIYRYNVLQRISQTQIYKYSILARVSLARVYKYNVLAAILRVSLARVYKYNVVQRVSKQSRLKWNIATLAVTQWGKIREWIYAKYAESDPSKQ